MVKDGLLLLPRWKGHEKTLHGCHRKVGLEFQPTKSSAPDCLYISGLENVIEESKGNTRWRLTLTRGEWVDHTLRIINSVDSTIATIPVVAPDLHMKMSSICGPLRQ